MIPALAVARSIDARTLGVGIGVALGVALLVVLVLKNAGKIGETVAKGVVDAGAGAVLGVGDALGVPRTDATECERAIAEGRTWDASFACPAGTFLGSLFGRAPAPSSPADKSSAVWPDDGYSPYLINPRERN